MAPGAGPESTLVGRTVAGYRILEPIGRGGMGEVYRALDGRLNRPVAVKSLLTSQASDPVSRRRFQRETRLACRVTHPYVATVFDVVEDTGSLYLVMEYIEGRRMDAVLREDRPDPQQVTTYATEIAEALRAIHKAGLVHRDLKPGNVMVTPDGHVKVMDFGVARPFLPLASDGTDASTLSTVTEAIGGTLQYMAPEQLRGGHVDHRSDLFSFGVMLYEALSGQHPFLKQSAMATASAILNELPGGGHEPITLTQSAGLRDVVMGLLEKDPERRIPSAQEALEALRACSRGEAPALSPAPARSPHAATWAWVAGGTAVLLAIAGSIWIASREGSAPASPPHRPTVVVLPFRGPDDRPEGALLGSTTASMLRADLSQSGLLQVVGSARTEELLSGIPPGERPSTEVLQRAMAATAAPILVTGSVQQAEGELHAALEVHDSARPDQDVGFRVQAASMPALVDRLSLGLKQRLPFLSGGDFARDEDRDVEDLASGSTAALLAAEQGRRAAERGAVAEADRHYGEAVAEDPGFLRAHIERAKTLYRAGYVTRAREAADEAAAEADATGRTIPERILLELQAVRCRVADDRRCEEAAQLRLAQRYSDEPEVLAELAETYRLSNKNKEALAALDQAIALSPGDPIYRLAQADLLRLQNQLPEAQAAIATAERLAGVLPGRPLEAAIALQQGFLCIKSNDFDCARERFRQAATEFAAAGRPLDVARTHLPIAQTYLEQGRLAEAIELLEKAKQDFAAAGYLRLEMSTLDALGAVYLQSGQMAKAEPLLRRAVDMAREISGDLPLVNPILNLASLLNQMGRGTEARGFAEEALRIAKRQSRTQSQATALLHLSNIETQNGEFIKAEKRYEEITRLLPPDRTDQRLAWAWTGIAEVRGLRGALRSALEAADRGVDLHAATGQSLNLGYARLGRARLRRLAGDSSGSLGDLEAAERVAREAKTAHDLDARCVLERGLRALEEDEDPMQALRLLEPALSLSEAAVRLTAPVRASIGVALAATGDRKAEAIRMARQALADARVRADQVDARLGLAVSLSFLGQTEESRSEALRALDDAEGCGMLWEAARAAAVALELPPAARPAAEDVVRSRGRAALDKFLEQAPGGAEGPASRRRAVLNVNKTLRG